MARRLGFILCLAIVCAVGVGASHARAAGPKPVIADGVRIGSVAVGRMTAAEAKVAVQHAYFARLVVHVGHRYVFVSPHRYHTVTGVNRAVRTALRAAESTSVRLKPTFDMQLVVNWLGALAAKTDRAPVSGGVILRGDRPVPTHAQPGRKLAKFPTRMRIRSAIITAVRKRIEAPLRPIAATAAHPEPIIVIHRGSNRLYLYQRARLMRTFPIATGMAQYPTPLGNFQIVVMWKNPWWYPPTQDAWARGLKPVPPGPGNPLGTRWMGLSAPGVGIHGTSEPWSIGHSESHGCIRMQIPSAEWLFNQVRIGTPVFIVPS